METPIRKIICGKDPKNGFAFVVGQTIYGGGTIHAITQDGRAEQLYGRSRFLIYIENEDGTMLWKSVDEMSCVLEYDLNF